MQSVNLTHHFLIAMPAMEDPFFAKSLVYIAEHNDQGALGIIVNRPTNMNLAALFKKIDLKLEANNVGDYPVFFGGPVQTDRGFVLHRPIGEWQSTLAVSDNTGLTSSRDILQAVAQEGQPSQILVTLGYSGWAAGQLEHELVENSWLTVPACTHILFDLSYEDRFSSALEMLGVDLSRLAGGAGHA